MASSKLHTAWFFICLASLLAPGSAQAKECVVLLHGLIRSADSMSALADHLLAQEYAVANIDYPSTEHPIETLAGVAVEAGLASCAEQGAAPVNFVTHSLGGILVRYYYSQHYAEAVGRVVMLAPPNQGSEVVDSLRDTPGFELVNGPAGLQLGTDAESIPSQLGPVNFELGVIAGTESINLLLSNYLPNPDDGKVSLEATKVEGMCGFLALPTSHPFIMSNDQAIEQVTSFLRTGRFSDEHAEALTGAYCSPANAL